MSQEVALADLSVQRHEAVGYGTRQTTTDLIFAKIYNTPLSTSVTDRGLIEIGEGTQGYEYD